MRRAQPRLQRDTGAGRPHLRGRRRVARRAGASRGGGKVLVLQPNRRNASRRNRKRGPVGQVVGSPRLALLVACAVGHRVVARPAGRDEPRCSRDEPRCAEMCRASPLLVIVDLSQPALRWPARHTDLDAQIARSNAAFAVIAPCRPPLVPSQPNGASPRPAQLIRC